MALTKVRGFGLGTLDDNITFSTAGKGVHLGVTSATSSNLMDDYEEASIDYAEEGDKNQIPWAGIAIVGSVAACAFGLPICLLPF